MRRSEAQRSGEQNDIFRFKVRLCKTSLPKFVKFRPEMDFVIRNRVLCLGRDPLTQSGFVDPEVAGDEGR